MKPEKFWLDDPCILLNSFRLIPTKDMDLNSRLNAMMRLTLVGTGVAWAVGTPKWQLVLVAGVVIVIAIKLLSSRNRTMGQASSTCPGVVPCDNPSVRHTTRIEDVLGNVTRGVVSPSMGNPYGVGPGVNGRGTGHNETQTGTFREYNPQVGQDFGPYTGNFPGDQATSDLIGNGGLVEPRFNAPGFYRKLSEPYCPYGAESCQFNERALQVGDTSASYPQNEYVCSNPYGDQSQGCPPYGQEGRPDLYKQQHDYPLTPVAYTEFEQPANFKSEYETNMRSLASCKLYADSRYQQDQSQFRNDMIRGLVERKNREVRKLPLNIVPSL
jgi:hypothetical protein